MLNLSGGVMADIITQEDLLIVLQHASNPCLRLKTDVLDKNGKIIGTLEWGLQGGSMSINGQSDVRRTANFIIQPTLKEKIKLTENSLLWLNKDIRMSIGLYNPRNKQYKYYPLGYYVYTDTSGTYDATTDNLTINCADFMKKLDGTKNGQLGALIISYPAYKENEETGEVIEYNIIRNAVIETLEKLARITNHRIDDIGEFYAMPEYNEDWEQYRKENADTWNTIPFDQEFSAGCSVLSILTTFRDLYPNYEMFFDMENNTFICQMIPSCYEDDIYIDNSFLQRVLISENTTIDMTTVRNICEVWGQVIEADFYSEECSYSNNTYSSTIAGYEEGYYNGDVIALKIPSVNQAGSQLNINNFGVIPILNEANEEPINAGELKPNEIYAFKIKKKRVDKQDVIKAYYLGQWQVHAINVLTNGKKSGKFVTSSDGEEYEIYVTAVNGAGETPHEKGEVTLTKGTPRRPADAPTIGTLKSGNASAVLKYIDQPGNDGGSKVTGYRIYAQEINRTDGSLIGDPMLVRTVNAVDSRMEDITIPDLVNGSRYQITVCAVNGTDLDGNPSNVAEVLVGLPEAPTNLKVEPGALRT